MGGQYKLVVLLLRIVTSRSVELHEWKYCPVIKVSDDLIRRNSRNSCNKYFHVTQYTWNLILTSSSQYSWYLELLIYISHTIHSCSALHVLSQEIGIAGSALGEI